MPRKEREEFLGELVGKPSKEAVYWVVRKNPEINRINLVIYPPRKPRTLREKLKAGRKDMPFSLTRRSLLEEDLLERMINRTAFEFALGIRSIVELKDRRKAHIPMMDFDCPPTPDNLKKIKIALRAIRQNHGIILQTDNSFHYMGSELLRTRREWEKFLGKWLLTDLVDWKFVGYQLVAGSCTLRISATQTRPHEPKVIDFIL